MTLRLEAWAHAWPMKEPFAIARGVQLDQPTVQVRLQASGGLMGRGESCGVPYAGETPQIMIDQLARIAGTVERGVTRAQLTDLLPPGGARHALDAALWDLEAKRQGQTAFAIAGVGRVAVTSAYTIGIRPLADYEATARRFAGFEVLKVKVDAQEPAAAIERVRRGAPDVDLIVDPNQSWTVRQMHDLAPVMAEMGVVLLEQPIPVGAEAELASWSGPVPLCADELVCGIDDLDRASDVFAVINIKLEKTGGLTAALRLAAEAKARGFRLMVGCMAGSSLSIAPAMILAQLCEFVDLDGPLLQAADVDHGFEYRNGRVERPSRPELWG